MSRDELLTPSLGNGDTQAPIHSIGAMIAAAFFGGAPAVPLLAAENSRLRGRLAKDAPWLILALVLTALLMITLTSYYHPDEPSDVRRNIRLFSRATGFAYVAAYFLLFRRIYRTQRMMGLDPPSPYGPVIAAVLGGIAVSALAYFAVAEGLIGDFL